VRLDGRAIDDLYGHLVEVVVETARDEAATAELVFETRRDVDGSWLVCDDPRVRPWSRLEVLAAFGATEEPILDGFVRAVDATFAGGERGPTVTVRAQDASLRLDREHVRANWTEDGPTTDGLVAQQIVAGRHGLALLPSSGEGLTMESLTQDATDAAFLRARAEANGYELIHTPLGVHFGPMRTGDAAQPTILVEAGPDTSALAFDVSVDATRPDAIAVDVPAETGIRPERRTFTPSGDLLGPEPADSASRGLGDHVVLMEARGGANAEELEARARGLAERSAFRITATGRLDGSAYGHVLRVGEPVMVDGTALAFAGAWYVDTVTHTFDPSGYAQRFTLLRNAFGDGIGSGAADPLALL